MMCGMLFTCAAFVAAGVLEYFVEQDPYGVFVGWQVHSASCGEQSNNVVDGVADYPVHPACLVRGPVTAVDLTSADPF
jgi:hypothetical protein